MSYESPISCHLQLSSEKRTFRLTAIIVGEPGLASFIAAKDDGGGEW